MIRSIVTRSPEPGRTGARSGLLVVAVVATVLLSTAAFAQVDAELLGGLEARSIGPAAMSGRVAAIDAVVSNPDIVYVGAATGGLWKSVDGGVTFEPIFDDQPVASIGAVTIDQDNPDVVWVGTGEGNPRNSSSVGNGIYKSIDGGETWSHLGLDDSERIHRIVLHPDDPDVAWVAAMGTAWGENPQRGVFKTVDGGETWEKVLFVDDGTGAADLVMDPGNPDKLFAAMWQYRRWPWFFESGGPGSGLWVTRDGGETWKEITAEDGLPRGDLGRIGIAVSRSDPETVYALVEAEKSALVRSDDGGRSWRIVNDEPDIAQRPFYYADIRVDPERPDRVYNVAGTVRVSKDGGESFETLVSFFKAHPDHHAFWIHPEDPTFIIDGNDGGIYFSHDRGETFRFVRNLPLAQFYHVAVDEETPYNVYGGLQDNGSWRGPNAIWKGGFFPIGIRNHEWTMVSFGDGFDTVPVPGDAREGYSMSQGGNLVRWNVDSDVVKNIAPPPPEGEELRFNWNAGLAVDPFDADTVYYGSQYLHRSTDRGDSWEIVSPDLTTDNPEWQRQEESGGLTLDVTAAENYTTIVAVAPSPVEEGVVWVGTDDGRLHLTRDGGGQWSSVEDNLPDEVPDHTWIPHVEASEHRAGTAFVVLDDHRRANWTPYVYRTDDWGESWASLVTDEIRGYVHVIEQDPVDPDLLFLGTEFGLWISVDGGESWTKFTHGIPTVAVRDLVVHPREHDLVVATHGRAAYVVDDVSPLRDLDGGLPESPLHLFDVPDAQQFATGTLRGSLFPGQGEFRGENQPYGAMITFSVSPDLVPENGGTGEEGGGAADDGAPESEEDVGGESDEPGDGDPAAGKKGGAEKVEIEVLDVEGETIRSFETTPRAGIVRTVWDLRRDAFDQPPREAPSPFGGARGPEVPAGDYTVVVSFGEHRAETPVRVLADPRDDATDADRRATWEAILEVGKLNDAAVAAVERIVETRSDVAAILKKAEAEMAKREDDERSGPGDQEGRDAGAAPDDSGGEETPAAVETEPGDADAGPGAVDPLKKLIEAGGKLNGRLDELERRFRLPPDTKGIPSTDDLVLSRIGEAMGRLTSDWDAPTAAERVFVERARSTLAEAIDEVNGIFDSDVPEFRRLVREAGVELLPEREPLELPGGGR